MLLFHLFIQSVITTSGLGLWILILYKTLSGNMRTALPWLLFHTLLSLLAVINMFLFLTYNLDVIFIPLLFNETWQRVVFIMIPGIYRLLRIFTIITGAVVLYNNKHHLLIWKSKLIPAAVSVIIISALSLLKSRGIKISPSLIIYLRLVLFLIVNMTVFTHLLRKMTENRKESFQKTAILLEKLLTDREKDVFRLLINHNSYKEISDKLFISMDTVKSHSRRIYRKTDTSCKNELLKKMEKSI